MTYFPTLPVFTICLFFAFCDLFAFRYHDWATRAAAFALTVAAVFALLTLAAALALTLAAADDR